MSPAPFCAHSREMGPAPFLYRVSGTNALIHHRSMWSPFYDLVMYTYMACSCWIHDETSLDGWFRIHTYEGVVDAFGLALFMCKVSKYQIT